MLNFISLNTFQEGNSKDLANNIEKKSSYTKGINGRIYSKDNTFSFESIDGSKIVYENSQIVKYLGFHSFRDETLVFAKVLKPTGAGGTVEEEICEQIISSEAFTVTADVAPDEVLYLGNKLSENSSQIESCYTITNTAPDPTNFELNYSEVNQEIDVIDFGEYFEERVNVANFKLCDLNLNEVPLNNLEYYDAIYSFVENENGNLKGVRLWVGAQNWPIGGKITAEGVEENQFYKRVYYSDAVNNRRVFNRKDKSLQTRKAKEFSQILDNVLLQAEVESIEDGGQCKAMKAMYIYRVISENGQVSEFSPFSFYAQIQPEQDAIGYRGGDISESTSKLVNIVCNIINPEPSSEIECVALEFETSGPPTSIRNLGVKPARTKVRFKHYGNEPEFADNITINDITEFKNTFLYANDYTSKKNKLIAAGLRNAPIPTQIENLEYLFPLHSWKEDGTTFESLMNPEPWSYRFIDPSNTNKLVYIKQKKYESISCFGPSLVSLKNTVTGGKITLALLSLSLEKYTDVTEQISDWLLLESVKEYFAVVFPNLKIEKYNDQLLFTPIDENIQSNFADYVFESNNNQFIENFQNDIVFVDPGVNTLNFVHGAESIGFNEGNGVRVSYKEVKEPLLNQATEVYTGGKILDYIAPSGETYLMKGEIYRLAFQAYDPASSRYFSIPLGDVMIPELGDMISSIDNQGNAIITSTKYTNQSVENGVLYGHGVKMKIEVRLDCELQKVISMYQILYVERTEENRTILCQGIAAPLYRLQFDGNDDQKMPEPLLSKWVLPYYGGPVYEKNGLRSYDELGENFDYQGDGRDGQDYKKIMTSRKLMTFDSPDIYFDKISSQHISSSRLKVVGKLNTDHTPNVIMQRGGYLNNSNEVYPKFSRKITEDYLSGDLHTEELPRAAREDRESGTYESYFINVSVFANYANVPAQEFIIKHSEALNRGQIISGSPFELNNDVSNNAMVMPCMPWFFSPYQRRSDRNNGKSRADLFREAVVSPGYPTVIIKTEQDLFTEDFVGEDIFTVSPEIRLGGGPHVVYETYPLINIFRNNRESVYGGRTQQSYSQNTFIPLSKTIPVSKNSGVQSFEVGADVYITLNIRTKNDAGENDIYEEIEFDNAGGGRARGEIKTFKRPGAWNSVVVLETQVEPKLTYQYEFYRQQNDFRFDLIRPEIINSAYLNTNSLKQFIPKPFKFRDDPNLGNIIAVSNPKLAGELYDSWTVFKPNNFYAELEKNKGDVSNILRQGEDIYAIQEDQTSLIYIGTDRIINDEKGVPINLKQGSGTVVEGHRVLSKFGTSIRRATTENEYGFVFFDEKKIEFVKIDQPLLVQKYLHLDYWDQMKIDPIVDSECYFDHQKKESNIRLRTRAGRSIMISYNELHKVFNGEYEMNNDLYIMFNQKIFAPLKNTDVITGKTLNKELHQLNEGDPLNLFGEQKTMKIGVVVNAEPTKILQIRQLGMVTSLKYPIKSVYFKTSLGQERIVPGTHPWYRIREGHHTIPPKLESNIDSEISDIRGNWIYVEIEMESKFKNKVDILAVINSLRYSHQ